MVAPQTTTWPLTAVTLAKHQILRSYLDAWFPVLGSRQKRLVYFDGFAGPGVYDDGSDGSPIVALKAVLEHPRLPDGVEFVFLFNEQNPGRHQSLVEVIDRLKAERSLPPNVKVLTEQSSFVSVVDQLTGALEERGASLAPTFAFIDPFGYQGMPMSSIQRLLQYGQSEVLAYFNVSQLLRFAGTGQVDHHFEALLGTDAFRNAPPSGDPTRREYFTDLYQRELKKQCGFKYTLSFLMRDDKNHPMYALVFGTRHPAGVAKMKSAMWKAAPDGSYTFSSRYAGEEVLFVAKPDLAPLQKALRAEFAGKTVAVHVLEWFTNLETPYRQEHLRTALKAMEGRSEITVTCADKQRRKNSYPKDARVTFTRLA